MNKSYILMMAAALLCLCPGCKKEKAPTELSLSSEELSIARCGLDENGEKVKLTVSSNTYWMATIPADASWVTCSPRGAGKGDTEISFTLDTNYEGGLRNTRIVFATADGTSRILELTQRGTDDAPLLNVSLTGKTWTETDTLALHSAHTWDLKFFYKNGKFTSLSDLPAETPRVIAWPFGTELLFDGENLLVTVPRKQKYSKDTGNADLPYTGVSSGCDFTLKPSFARLNLNLKGQGEILSVAFCSEDVRYTLNMEKPVVLSKTEVQTLPIALPEGKWETWSIGITDVSGDEVLREYTSPLDISLGGSAGVDIEYTSTNVYISLNAPAFYGEPGTDKVYSNCFMIKNPGMYKFLCADATGKKITAQDAKWVWATTGVWNSASACRLDELITDIGMIDDAVVFTVPEDFTPGNVIIGAVDSEGAILASWHIWTTIDYNEVEAGGNVWMDRNLGASYFFHDPMNEEECNASRGLHFQWGCKNPIVGPYEGDRNVVAGDTFTMGKGATYYIWNEEVRNTGLWGVMKTYPADWIGSLEQAAAYPMSMFDNASKAPTAGQKINWPAEANPCPHGYDVMTLEQAQALGYDKTTMKTISQNEATKSTVNVASVLGELIFPSSSWRISGGKLDYAGNPEGRYWLKEPYDTENRTYWLMNRSNCQKANGGKLGYAMSIRCVKTQTIQ